MEYMDKDKLLSKSNNSVFKLVNLAAMRAMEIADGKPKLVVEKGDVKPSTVALHEIAAGFISSKRTHPKE